jgi:hypothetical protein
VGEREGREGKGGGTEGQYNQDAGCGVTTHQKLDFHRV